LSLFRLNLMLVVSYLWIVLGRETELLLSASLLASVIVAAQTPILVRSNGIGMRLLVHYASMLVFLFCLGAVLSWDAAVGSHQVGSWTGRIDAGLRIAILGQVFAFPGFLLISPVNIALLKRTSR